MSSPSSVILSYPSSLSLNKLFPLLAAYGEIVHFGPLLNTTGDSNIATALVSFTLASSAEAAIEALNNTLAPGSPSDGPRLIAKRAPTQQQQQQQQASSGSFPLGGSDHSSGFASYSTQQQGDSSQHPARSQHPTTTTTTTSSTATELAPSYQTSESTPSVNPTSTNFDANQTRPTYHQDRQQQQQQQQLHQASAQQQQQQQQQQQTSPTPIPSAAVFPRLGASASATAGHHQQPQQPHQQRQPTGPPTRKQGASSPSPPGSLSTSSSDPLPEDTPERSRLFVVIPKTMTNEVVETHFAQYQGFQWAKVILSRNTNESKGVAYVKYATAHAAALAMEATQRLGSIIGDSKVKVMVAEPKASVRSYTVPMSNAHPLSSMSAFQLAPSQQGISPALSPSAAAAAAALARTQIQQAAAAGGEAMPLVAQAVAAAAAVRAAAASANAVYTAPPPAAAAASSDWRADASRRSESEAITAHLAALNVAAPLKMPPTPNSPHVLNAIASAHSVGGAQGPDPASTFVAVSKAGHNNRLFVVCKGATQDQLTRIFSQLPGLLAVDVKTFKESGEPRGFAFVTYSTHEQATFAIEIFNGFEHAPGAPKLSVMFADPPVASTFKDPNAVQPTSSLEQPAPGLPRDPRYPSQQTLPLAPPGFPPAHPADALRAAAAPMQLGSTGEAPSTGAAAAAVSRSFPPGSRLFIVLSKPVPQSALITLFQPFPGFVTVRLQRNKNYGYAKYTTAAGAEAARAALHGFNFGDQRMKVMLADPPPPQTPASASPQQDPYAPSQPPLLSRGPQLGAEGASSPPRARSPDAP